jgi:hypothetical protein
LKRQLDSIDENLPRKTAREVLNNCEVTGAVNITQMDLQRMFEDQFSRFAAQQQQLANALQVSSTSSNPDNTSSNNNGYRTFSWGGRFHSVPQNFRFPDCDVKTIWEIWYFGYPNENIAPLNSLKNWDLTKKACRTKLSYARNVMEELFTHTTVDLRTIKAMSATERDGVFDVAYRSLLSQFGDENYVNSRRSIGYRTVYDNINRRKKRLAQEV